MLPLRPIRNKDMLPYFGTRARTSEILNRRRPLTLEMIRKLADGLKLPADLLVKPYALHSYPDHATASPV
jgi:HTH-type transcriptional regulator/antitoxin HigA